MLRRLKKRDFEFWAWKAQKVLIEKEVFFVNMIRIAMGTNESYMQFFHEKQSDLLRLDGKLEQVQKEAWEDLKMKRRG